MSGFVCNTPSARWINPPRCAAVSRRGNASDSAHPPRRHPRAGLTLPELLVVIGIIAVLIGLLVPVLHLLRQHARDVVCVGRLRDLTLASHMYYGKYGRFPDPPRETGGALPPAVPVAVPAGVAPGSVVQMRPQNIHRRLLNELSEFLKYPPLSGPVPVADLPAEVQCPSVEDVSVGRGPTPTPDGRDQGYYTGYVYTGRLAEAPNMMVGPTGALTLGLRGAGGPIRVAFPTATRGAGGTPAALLPVSARAAAGITPVLPAQVIGIGVALKPAQSARSPADVRAVLWADNVHLSAPGGGGYWQFAHPRRGAAPRPGPSPLTYADPGACRGQHRAYGGGAVDWTAGENLGLGPTGPAPDAAATYRLGPAYWWF